MGVHVGNQPYHLRIAGLLLSQITDALPLWNCLGHAVLVGVDTVRWDFLDFSSGIFVEEVGVRLGLYFAVDGQIVHRISTTINVQFAQSLFRSIRSGSRYKQQTHDQDGCQ